MGHRHKLAELEALFLGPKLGKGLDRTVYGLGQPGSWCTYTNQRGITADPNRCQLVIKVERPGSFQNAIEWELWCALGDTRMGKWLAPCEAISPCGMYLIQRRVEPIRKADRPKKLPGFLCDFKRENFGLYEGRVVCCDYGIGIESMTQADRRLRPVKWTCG